MENKKLHLIRVCVCGGMQLYLCCLARIEMQGAEKFSSRAWGTNNAQFAFRKRVEYKNTANTPASRLWKTIYLNKKISVVESLEDIMD